MGQLRRAAVRILAAIALFATCATMPATQPCIEHACTFATNVTFDSLGDPDTRPGTWGTAAFRDVTFPVMAAEGVPVRIVRIRGTFQAWARGPAAAGTNAGFLWGILTAEPGQSPFVGPGLGSSNCIEYMQSQVGPWGSAIPFDSAIADGTLPNNKFIIRQAIFLNDTGLPIHEEVTLVVEFQYENRKAER